MACIVITRKYPLKKLDSKKKNFKCVLKGQMKIFIADS